MISFATAATPEYLPSGATCAVASERDHWHTTVIISILTMFESHGDF
jgi:hypothetical protein